MTPSLQHCSHCSNVRFSAPCGLCSLSARHVCVCVCVCARVQSNCEVQQTYILTTTATHVFKVQPCKGRPFIWIYAGQRTAAPCPCNPPQGNKAHITGSCALIPAPRIPMVAAGNTQRGSDYRRASMSKPSYLPYTEGRVCQGINSNDAPTARFNRTTEGCVCVCVRACVCVCVFVCVRLCVGAGGMRMGRCGRGVAPFTEPGGSEGSGTIPGRSDAWAWSRAHEHVTHRPPCLSRLSHSPPSKPCRRGRDAQGQQQLDV